MSKSNQEQFVEDTKMLKKLPSYAQRYAAREILELAKDREQESLLPCNKNSAVVMKKQAEALELASRIIYDLMPPETRDVLQ